MTVGLVIGCLVAAIAAYTDWRYRKVYNWLTVPAMVLGLFLGGLESAGLNAGVGGYRLSGGIGDAVAGLAVGAALYPLAHWDLLGPGDMKLVAALGALAGWQVAVVTLMAGTLVGGIVAVGVLAWVLGRKFWHAAASAALASGVVPVRQAIQSFGEALKIRLPYAVFLAFGYFVAVAAWWLAGPFWLADGGVAP